MKSTSAPLSGMKIAVLVESEYIPEEIADYQKKFAALGAQVDLMSDLWGQEKITFHSDAADTGKAPETLEVSMDFQKVRLEDYAAVIMAAKYPSVRLRWFDAPEGEKRSADMVRTAPAVRFFSRAMRNRNIIKAAPCHALWLLTPEPELLAGRKITCNPVVLADIVNTGALYIPTPADQEWDMQVVVDDDLITTTSYRSTDLMVDAMKTAILARANIAPKSPASTVEMMLDGIHSPRQRKILCLLSEWGYWGEELIGPIESFDAAGYDVDFCTPTGKRPNAIAVSWDPEFVDPALGRPVTSQEMAAKVLLWDDPTKPEGKRLENPINMSELMPDQPYTSSPNSVRALEAYNRALEASAKTLEKYDALLIVGGSGPVVDLVNNSRVHDIILTFYRTGRPIGAECYGVTCLAFARDPQDRKSIIRGKHVTGHCLEYDYKDGTAFMKARGEFLDFNMGPAPYPLEYILRDATGPNGAYIGNFGHDTSVIVDYPFITGRSTPDSYMTGQKMIEALDGEPPLRRFGW